jgi:L-fucose mutarotase
MIKFPLLHPEILRALAAAGHGSRVLIADGNYPLSTATHASATRVYLNLRPGCVTVPDVLATLVSAIPIESAMGMQPRDGALAPIHSELTAILGTDVPFTLKARHDFYAEARSTDMTLAISTGEQRRFANVLLTLGVIRLPGDAT